jgi:hypothetical protein
MKIETILQNFVKFNKDKRRFQEKHFSKVILIDV